MKGDEMRVDTPGHELVGEPVVRPPSETPYGEVWSCVCGDPDFRLEWGAGHVLSARAAFLEHVLTVERSERNR